MKDKFFANFLIKVTVLGILLSGLSVVLLPKYSQTFTPNKFHIFNLFVSTITVVTHYFLMQAGKKRVQKFINSFMIATTIKLMIFFFSIVIYAFTHRAEAAPFIISFFALYLCNTVLEILEILIFLKSVDNDTQDSTNKYHTT